MVMNQGGAPMAGGSGMAQQDQGPCDFEFPVELEQGFAPKIRWNRGDDPGAVADRFLQANNLPMSNKPDIIAFIQQASGTPGAAAVAPPTSAPSAEVQQNMVNQ